MAGQFDYQDNLVRTLERAIAIFDVLAVFKSSELAEECVEPLADLGREILWAAKKETAAAFSAEHDARMAAEPVPAENKRRPLKQVRQIAAAAIRKARELDRKTKAAKKAKKRAA